MNEHAEVIRECLNYLYRRIPEPLARDKARHRIGLKALSMLAGAPNSKPSMDVTGLTVAQVQSAVEAGKVTAADALQQESSGKNRVSLIGWLEERAG
jgi:hypothetical protein